ncbi:PREDICTED: uncharacterized protein LOC105448100 [Wasmannia auropunctata]|uniref:uncharacterized protein LOC105448100 n=1 Tax=Wasmannia auropunctata TaxID=64793 RepID=UPI0005EDF9A4|nr:PREDICTED: uncharacterized protein LOC105448100 [Wasmannia auropunctata]
MSFLLIHGPPTDLALTGQSPKLNILGNASAGNTVFGLDIWMTLVVVIIITSTLLTIMKKTKNRYFSWNLMSDNYIKVWGIYCQQGLSEFPRELPMRVAFFSIYISSIVILAIYSASLMSFLMLNLPKLPFSTLEDYVNDGTYKLIVLKNSAEYDIPSRIKDPMFLKMYELLEEKKYLPTTLAEGFKQICHREKLAFYTTEVFKEAMNMYVRCKVVYIDTGRVDNLGLTLSKGNPYTGFINYHLRRFHLNGVMDKLRNKYLTRKSKNIYIFGVTVDIFDITPTLTIVVGNLQITHLIHASSRLLSQRFVKTANVHFRRLNISLRYYRQIVQPVTIVILPNYEAYLEFAEATKFYPMSFPVWFVLFLYTPDNSTHDHCREPIGNPFNLAFDTQMLVLCHNEIVIESPRELSMRLVFFSIYISSIIILAIYSATLVSFLTLNLPKLPFSTLEDYVNDGTYKLIVLQNSAEYDIPTRMKDPVFLKMYDLLEEKKYLPTTLAEGFKQVCHREKLAFYTTMVFKEAMNRYIRCRVVYIDTGRIDNMGLTLSKGNPYTGFINYHLRRFHLNGVMDKLRNKYLRNSRPKIYILGIVDIYDITPTLTIVVGSMILALFILLIEKKYYSFKTLSKNKESFIKKVSHNVGAKNKMRKRNDEKNLRHQEFYNKPIIYYGYWP